MIRVPFATRGDGVRTQACNKLREIYSGLSKLENLVMLDLGGNRLRKMEHLPPNLEKLFLGKNKIETIERVADMRGRRGRARRSCCTRWSISAAWPSTIASSSETRFLSIADSFIR